MKKVKTILLIAADGTMAVDNGSTTPATTDMVITSYTDPDKKIDELKIDAPVVGELSTEAQRKTVNEQVADWLGKRRMKLSAATGNVNVHKDVREEDGYKIPFITVTMPQGRPTSEQITSVCEIMLPWIKATGEKPVTKKPDDGKKSGGDDSKKSGGDDSKKSGGDDTKSTPPKKSSFIPWDPTKTDEENLEAIMGPID